MFPVLPLYFARLYSARDDHDATDDGGDAESDCESWPGEGIGAWED